MSKIEKALKRAAAERKSGFASPMPSMPSDGHQLSVINPAMVETPVGSASMSTIARMAERTPRNIAELQALGVVTPAMGENPVVRSFREARTKILQKTGGRNSVVMVAAVTRGNGASFVAMNLSAAFAFDVGKTALLVDCNLKSPSLQRFFAKTPAKGLIDFLEGSNVDVAEIIHSVGVDRLRVIPAGNRSDKHGEYFTSAKMKNLIGALRARYPERFIILDAPSVLESADTQILSELCDHVVLVVPYGAVTSLEIERAVKAIDRNKLIGFIFNNEPNLPPLRELWRK